MTKVIAREISDEEYMDLAQNGARELFYLCDFKVMDGCKDEDTNPFIVDYETEKMYLIDLDTCYDLVTRFYCGGCREYLVRDLAKITMGSKRINKLFLSE